MGRNSFCLKRSSQSFRFMHDLLFILLMIQKLRNQSSSLQWRLMQLRKEDLKLGKKFLVGQGSFFSFFPFFSFFSFFMRYFLFSSSKWLCSLEEESLSETEIQASYVSTRVQFSSFANLGELSSQVDLPGVVTQEGGSIGSAFLKYTGSPMKSENVTDLLVSQVMLQSSHLWQQKESSQLNELSSYLRI